MNLTAASIFCFYLLWRVYELSMENVRYGEIALAQEGVDVSTFLTLANLRSKGGCTVC